MCYQDKYAEYLDSVPATAQKCRETGNRIVLGYTSDLDAILSWNTDRFNRLVEQYLKVPLTYEEEESIDSMEDFVRILGYFAVHGMGGEVAITSAEVVECIRKQFDIRYAMGGTCAQGAAALSVMGVPAVIHITDRSREVIDELDYPGLESVRDGKRVPMRECVSGLPPLLHLIIQFSKGDILRINNESYEVPLSNRMIAEYDNVHKILPVEPDFLSYIEQNAGRVCCYSVSGYNAIEDPAVAEERVAQFREHFRKVKEKNPNIKIYLESAHYISSHIRDMVYSGLAPWLDVLGMNEEELANLTARKSHPVNTEDLQSILTGLDYVLEQYPVKGIIMHSKDYSLYYGAPVEGIDMEKGLTLGNLMSGTRARIGRYGTMEDCRKTLELDLSPVGLRFAEELSHMELPHEAVLVPSRYMEKPACTVGLGDTFVAGVQICFAG